jgi:hypothetical protein
MSESRAADDLLTMYTDKMGDRLGPFFHHLWQDLAHLHLKWNEYLPLFGRSEARFNTIMKAAPGFFGMVYDMWWNDILLMLWKLTDKDTRTLSILRLKELTPVILQKELEPRVAAAVAACEFAHTVRHTIIAHRNADIAMKRAPMPESSREDVRKAIAALDEVFNLLHSHYTEEDGMMWDHLDALGGSEQLLWLVRRALKAREDDFAARRPPMRFPD